MKKKILSFVCILSMIATLFVSVTSVYAEGEKVSIEYDKASTDTNVVLKVYLEGYTYLTTYKFKIDLSAFKDKVAFPEDADVSTAVKQRNYIRDNYVVPSGIVASTTPSKSFLATWYYQSAASVSTAEPMTPADKELVFTITLPLKEKLTEDVVVSIMSDNTDKNTYMATVEEDETTDTGYSSNPKLSFPECGSVTVTKPAAAEKAAVKGNEVNGSQMFSTSEAITMPENVDDVTVTITNDKVTDKTIEETVGKNTNVLGSGTTKFIPIVSYKIGDTSLKGSIFTIKVTNGSSNLGTWTYTVPTE